MTGLLLVNKKDFSGYNEDLEGWGYDDVDLYNRLKTNNINQLIFFLMNKYVKHLDHPDEDRVKNYREKNVKISNTKNKKISSEQIMPIKFTQYLTIESTDEHSIVQEI
jgi:hypothetical protein